MTVQPPLDHFEPLADSIQAARDRIAKYAVRTPILESQELNRLVGARVLIKPENLQRSGSFKLRGALNRALQLNAAERDCGVVTWSSGNHGLAISFVAKELGIRATVLMPYDAPKTKVEGVRQNGANVRLYDKTKEDREEIGAQIAAESGAVIVPPYDDPYVITGQATLGAEMALALLAASTRSCRGRQSIALRPRVLTGWLFRLPPVNHEKHPHLARRSVTHSSFLLRAN